jgi:hypothetical protein
MKKIFIVTMPANNTASVRQFGFENLEDANKFREYLDQGNGGSSTPCVIHVQHFFEKNEFHF